MEETAMAVGMEMGRGGQQEELIMRRSRKDSYSIVGSMGIFIQLLTLLAFVWWRWCLLCILD